MTYHRKRERQLRLSRTIRDRRNAHTIAQIDPEQPNHLVFPRTGPFQAHRLYLYAALPFQTVTEGVGDIRPRCANGMRLKNFSTIVSLARITGKNMEDLQRWYAARVY